MANIIDKEKNKDTNTFYVNPDNDIMGVTFPEGVYTDGIEIPDKFVTVNGNIDYHLLDAANIDWDKVKIPWAKKITKWGGNGRTIDANGSPIVVKASDMYAPDYNYSKPSDDSWITGEIKESEEVADILNYLLYRVVSLDYFMDFWDSRDLKSSELRVVNNRMDYYQEDVDPEEPMSEDDVKVINEIKSARIIYADGVFVVNDEYISIASSGKKASVSDFNGKKITGISLKSTPIDYTFLKNLPLKDVLIKCAFNAANIKHWEVDRIIKVSLYNDNTLVDIKYIVAQKEKDLWVSDYKVSFENCENVNRIVISTGPDFDSTVVVTSIFNYAEETKSLANADNYKGDGDKTSTNHAADKHYTLNPLSGAMVYLYPYLLANEWVNPTDETHSDVVPFIDSKGQKLTSGAVLLSDLNWEIQRDLIFAPNHEAANKYTRLNKDGVNFDIYQVETRSNSSSIHFISENVNMLDGFVQTVDDKQIPTYTEITGILNGIEVIERLYKFPAFVKRCNTSEQYNYTPFDLFTNVFKDSTIYGIPNLAHTYDDFAKSRHSSLKQLDVDTNSVNFRITIDKTEEYAAEEISIPVTIYKGLNTLYDFSISEKSHETGNTITTFNSFNEENNVKVYSTQIPVASEEATEEFKFVINIDTEFGPKYDSECEDVLQHSHIFPYFAIKSNTESATELTDICINSIEANKNNYITIQSDTFNKENNNTVYVLYDNDKYGKVTYENVLGKFEYVYYPPVGLDEDVNATLYCFMYYPVLDKTTPRLLRPLYCELPLNLQVVKENKIIFGGDITTLTGYDDNCGKLTVKLDATQSEQQIDLNNIISTVCDAENQKVAFTTEFVGYSLINYPDRKSVELDDMAFGKYVKTPVEYTDFIMDGNNPKINSSDTIPERWCVKYSDTQSSINIPAITISNSIVNNDNKLNIKMSTALYPDCNGVMYTEDFSNLADADNDYFYAVYKIVAPKNYDGTTTTGMYEEATAYLFVNVTRDENVNVTLPDIDINTLESVNLDNLFNTLVSKYTNSYVCDFGGKCETDVDGKTVNVLHKAGWTTETEYAMLADDIELNNLVLHLKSLRNVIINNVGETPTKTIEPVSDALINLIVCLSNSAKYKRDDSCITTKIKCKRTEYTDIKVLQYTGTYKIMENPTYVTDKTPVQFCMVSDKLGDNDGSNIIDLDDIIKGDLTEKFGLPPVIQLRSISQQIDITDYDEETGLFTLPDIENGQYTLFISTPTVFTKNVELTINIAITE